MKKAERARRKRYTAHTYHGLKQGPPLPVDAAENVKQDQVELESTDLCAEPHKVTQFLREWITVELKRDDQKKVAVLIVQACVKLGVKMEAATITGELVVKTEHTVRDWRQDFICKKGAFSEESMYECQSLTMKLPGKMQ